jgi:hypothetical protein
MDILDEIKSDYELCINKPHEYQLKVDSISDLFFLKVRQRLKGDNCPVYVVGRYESAPFVMFGINPGYSSINNPIEEKEARKSWEHYQNLYRNFFLFFSHHGFESPYYTSLWYLLSGLVDCQKEIKSNKWKLFDSYLTNLELIPYHSEGITLPSRLLEPQLDYLKGRFRNNVDFIIRFKPKLFIFNGNIWYILLIKNSLVEKYQKASLSDKFNLYFFEIEGIPCVLFDKFFQRHFWGITDQDRMVRIPKLIHEKYHNL